MKPGPKPLPGNVHQLRGNPSKKPIGDLLGDVQPEIEIPGCPSHLLKEARKEWKRITPELVKLGLIAKIDRAALALYCQAWAWLVYHEIQLQRAMDQVMRQREAFEAREEQCRIEFERREEQRRIEAETKGETYQPQIYTPAVWDKGDGFMLPTPNGSFTYSPHWVGKNKSAEQVDKFLASFGMSPSSRSRVTASDQYPYLPGMEPGADTAGQNKKPASLASFVNR